MKLVKKIDKYAKALDLVTGGVAFSKLKNKDIGIALDYLTEALSVISACVIGRDDYYYESVGESLGLIMLCDHYLSDSINLPVGGSCDDNLCEIDSVKWLIRIIHNCIENYEEMAKDDSQHLGLACAAHTIMKSVNRGEGKDVGIFLTIETCLELACKDYLEPNNPFC